MEFNAKCSPDPQVILREDFPDWALLFHPLTGEAVGLGESGVLIWKSLDGRRTLAEIAAALAARCGAPPEVVLEDTLAFAQDLYRRLFIRTDS